MSGVPADDDAVGRALVAVVSRWGAGIASDPRRLQGGLEDELMGDAASHRSEVQALLVAAEESIPASLAQPGFDRTAAIRRLRARELDDRAAANSIDTWRRGLGLDRPAPLVPPPWPPSPDRSRRQWNVAAIAVVSAIVVAGAAVAFAIAASRGTPTPSATTASTVRRTTSTVVRTTVTTVPPAPTPGGGVLGGNWSGAAAHSVCEGFSAETCNDAEPRRWDLWIDCSSGPCYAHEVWWGALPETLTRTPAGTWTATQSGESYSCETATGTFISRTLTIAEVESQPKLHVRIEDNVPPGPCGTARQVWEFDAAKVP